MKKSFQFFVVILFVLVGGMLQAQYSEKKIKEFVKKINENVEAIHQERAEFQKLEKQETDEYYKSQYYSYISPFWDYDFEVLEKFKIEKNGEISWKVKYMPEGGETFIYSVKGNLKDLELATIDIYFILEFKTDTLEKTYEYLDSGRIESFTDSMIHFGIDQKGLVFAAEKAGIEVYGY